MATILITNDDGIDSPMLVPLASALQPLGEVHTVVPDQERSWMAKAISRFDRLSVRSLQAETGLMHAVSGTPADCANLGLFELFRDQCTLVVSGINLGLNFGTAFFLSSGTVGAAIEACIAGIPAIAFSMALPQDAYGLSGAHRSARLGDLPVRASAVAAEITEIIIRHGFPPGVDLFSVNLPADVQLRTRRRLTPIARTAYASLFTADGAGGFRHQIRQYDLCEPDADSDVSVVRRGEVSIAPVRLQLDTAVPAHLAAALEVSGESGR